MARIEQLFGHLDRWRHLPNYQLERRADIFFSLYLPEVLKHHLALPDEPAIVPEFPLHLRTLDLDEPVSNESSCKADYLAVSIASRQAVLVELKTDVSSRRDRQDAVLKAAAGKPFADLLKGILTIHQATRAKAKYACLLRQLHEVGLLQQHDGTRHGRGAYTASIRAFEPSRVVYIQPMCNPKEHDVDIICFKKFAATVRKHDDPLSKRFAASLENWAATAAGITEPGEPRCATAMRTGISI